MTTYSVTTKTTKIAWRRDPSVPAGQPATGTFRCPCGGKIEGVWFADDSEHTCQCGRVWDSRGWLVSEPQDGTLPAGLKATRQGEGLLGW